MGIAYYFSWIIKNHKNIIQKNNLKNVNNLYIDSNSIIYDSINFNNYISTNQFEEFIIDSTIKKLKSIISIFKPNNKIIIAFDGVPPMAKIKQQKNRRYKSWYTSYILAKQNKWNTSSITPGTNFMEKLNTEIFRHFNSSSLENKNILLLLSDTPGEGEHKIFQYIRNNSDIHTNSNTVIYGMDSDLIMLSLKHLYICNNIYLYRETPEFIKNIDNSLSSDNEYIINIYNLAEQIYLLMTQKHEKYEQHEQHKEYNNDLFYKKINDYILITYLLGNDFMPHFPAINIRHNGITILLDLYRSKIGKNNNLTNNNIVILKTFKSFIENLAINEEQFIINNFIIKNKSEHRVFNSVKDLTEEEKLNLLPQYERNIEKFINPSEEDWRYRYYYSLFNIDYNNEKDKVNEICNNYLKTLLWTLNYYSGDCNNWKHYYKYEYPPLLVDLYKNIPYFDSELKLEENKEILNKYVLLAYVLPKKSLNLLPEKIEKYLIENHYAYYKENLEIQYAYCKYFWESHIVFESIENTNIESYILNNIS